jgi:hypothetical protein
LDSPTLTRKKAWVKKKWGRRRFQKQQNYRKWERERWKRELKRLDDGGGKDLHEL